MCLLLNKPKSPKNNAELAVCFNPYFSVFKPSIQKTLMIQSLFGWTTLVLPKVSSYFGPIILVLKHIWEDFILPIKLDSGKVALNPKFTHATFIGLLVNMLVNLASEHWRSFDDSKADHVLLTTITSSYPLQQSTAMPVSSFPNSNPSQQDGPSNSNVDNLLFTNHLQPCQT